MAEMTRQEKQAILIERLNSLVPQLVSQGNSLWAALEMAANNYDMDMLASSEGDTCRIYQHGSVYVNCWMEGELSKSPADGVAGFDDQIDWYFES